MLQQQAPKSCPSFSSIWLMTMNVLYAILGIVLMAGSSWGIDQAQKNPVTAVIPLAALNALVTVGVFLMILSILGCFGVKFNYKVGGRYVLGTYAFLMVLVMLMEFGAAITLFTFIGKLDEFGPAQQFRDNGIFMLTNNTFNMCCFNGVLNPNRTWNGCWLADNLAYPCDQVGRFNIFLANYVEERIQPVAAVALFLCFLQLFTAITACCAQCNGRKAEAAKSIGGPLSYDGLYSEGEETYSGYGYDSYVKTGQARAGGAPGATAPRAPAPGGPRGPAVPPRPAAPGPRPAAPGGPAKPPA